MKKIFLFLFLLASVIVSTKTLAMSNSLSPPAEPLDAISVNSAAKMMLQTPIAQPIQIDVGLFESDVSGYSLFESCKLVMPDTDVGCAVNFQVLANSNIARTLSGKSDCLLQATSPQCRAVMLNDFSLNLTNCNAVDLTQATSPNCRDVFSLMV